MEETALLSTETVGRYLARRGVVADGAAVEARELGGGVSNVVLEVRADGLACVVKQALPRLRVADLWLARRERAITEGRAIELAARLTPGAVPALLDVDEEACALTIARAPAGWRNWKERLLAGDAQPEAAARVGELLAAWHAGTWNDEDAARDFAGAIDAFHELRLDPYHRTVMRRHPHLAAAIDSYVERLLSRRCCLVHGDYSPKNVLVGDDGLWIVDFEVAHFGDPVFDAAFMLNHLFLKAIHRPDSGAGYERCAEAFWGAYRARAPGEIEGSYLLGHLGCLMLARVDGKSPAEYLTEDERAHARRAGTALLLEPPETLAEAWPLVRELARA